MDEVGAEEAAYVVFKGVEEDEVPSCFDTASCGACHSPYIHSEEDNELAGEGPSVVVVDGKACAGERGGGLESALKERGGSGWKEAPDHKEAAEEQGGDEEVELRIVEASEVAA